ncbi:MAG: ATP-binding cassette domain-containing protein, partial [Actinomycetia bacterium]|nr:ATP-binding cassette domain-containing protein [Actinomycetes bacterium]
MLLETDGLTTRYGSIAALRDVSLSVGAGEIVGLIGPNGAGKTTLMATVAGLLRPASGTVNFDGSDITGAAPERTLKAGLALVPEHRRIFVDLTVAENLRIGGVTVSANDRQGLLVEMAEL